MRINTLTTYDVYNYGASLQAYALMTYLQNKDNEVEIIISNLNILPANTTTDG